MHMRVDFRLYLVSDRHQCPGDQLLDRVASAVKGGVGAVQLREKDLSGSALHALAAALLPICRRNGARLLVNDRIDVALSVGADGVHLPADSFAVSDARRLLGPDRLIGVSTHSVAEVAVAHAAGADFVVFGPVYATPSKAAFGLPLGLELLRAAVVAAPIPVFAIGGITPRRASEIAATGAHGVAAVSSILAAADPALVAAELIEILRGS